MNISIGVITARESLSNIRKVDEIMKEHCDITYLPYSSMQELTKAYVENASKFDGFLFSGAFPHDYIMENICAISKPCCFLDINDRDFYWLFAKLFSENPGIDFSRVNFDKPTDISPFENVFTENNMPILSAITPFGSYAEQLQQYYSEAMIRYQQLWAQGKVDLFIVRLTNLANSLKSQNIPYILLQPSPATIRDYFFKLIAEIQQSRLQNALTACCVIKIAKDIPEAADYDKLEKELLQFNEEQNMAFVIRRNGDLFDIVTSSTVSMDITSNYSTCLLTSVMYERLGFSTWIGWGINFDVATAHKNALLAIRHSQKDTNRYTYLINEKDEMVGPLVGDRSISYAVHPSSRTSYIGKALGISASNLEKIISLQEKKFLKEFSADDLSFYLNITLRSATRILKKLSEHGGAFPIKSEQLVGRGRPATIYQIDLKAIVFDE